MDNSFLRHSSISAPEISPVFSALGCQFVGESKANFGVVVSSNTLMPHLVGDIFAIQLALTVGVVNLRYKQFEHAAGSKL